VLFFRTMRSLAASFLIGVAAGTFGGLVGLGGGVVMIPLMVGTAGLRQHEAHGTSLVALVFTGAAGAITYASRGAVDFVAAGSLAIPAVATARLGARYAHALPEWQLKRAFGAFLIFVTALLLLKPYLIGFSEPAGGPMKIGVLLAAGGLSGFLSGMMGIGGGSLMVPAMVLLAGFPQVLAQGSSLLAMVPAGAAGAHKHWQLGNVVRRLLPGLVPGILVGTWLGSSAALRLDESSLRAAFAIVVAYSGVRFLRAPRPKIAVESGMG
jgi:hypothetical protein